MRLFEDSFWQLFNETEDQHPQWEDWQVQEEVEMQLAEREAYNDYVEMVKYESRGW